jgi:hypothetical protein
MVTWLFFLNFLRVGRTIDNLAVKPRATSLFPKNDTHYDSVAERLPRCQKIQQ